MTGRMVFGLVLQWKMIRGSGLVDMLRLQRTLELLNVVLLLLIEEIMLRLERSLELLNVVLCY